MQPEGRGEQATTREQRGVPIAGSRIAGSLHSLDGSEMLAPWRLAPYVAALVCGLALRLWWVHAHAALQGDPQVYADIARNWLQHGVYGITVPGPAGNPAANMVRPTIIRLPGYPLFLAICFKLFGVMNFRAVLLVQVVADLLTCALLAACARRLWSRRARHGHPVAGSAVPVHGDLCGCSTDRDPGAAGDRRRAAAVRSPGWPGRKAAARECRRPGSKGRVVGVAHTGTLLVCGRTAATRWRAARRNTLPGAGLVCARQSGAWPGGAAGRCGGGARGTAFCALGGAQLAYLPCL